jgi:hypothetical protein
MCTANAIEMLAATRTPSRFVEEVRRDDPLTAECVGGHSRTLAQAKLGRRGPPRPNRRPPSFVASLLGDLGSPATTETPSPPRDIPEGSPKRVSRLRLCLSGSTGLRSVTCAAR